MIGPLRALGSRLRGLRLFNRRWIGNPIERAHHDSVVAKRIGRDGVAAEPAAPSSPPAADTEPPEA